MTNAIGALDLKDTRISIAIPLAAVGVLGAIQLALGTDPVIIALCALGIAAPLIPLHLYGRDLYAMIGIVFSLRYVGVALIAKTLLGQTLESHLLDAYRAFSLTALFMCVVTAILLIARAMDAGKTLFNFATDQPSLRRLAVVCFSIGVPAEVIARLGMQGVGEASSGSIFPALVTVGDLIYFGLIAEAIGTIKKTDRQTFLSPLLLSMIAIALVLALGFNGREFFISCLIGVVTAAFAYKALRLRHIIYGAVFVAFFVNFMTPITLYLRIQREGMDKAQFLALTRETVIKAITEPNFFRLVTETVAEEGNTIGRTDGLYDYYQNSSNVLNRLSYVALVNSIAYPAQSRKLIGMEDVVHAFANNAPGFLGYEKPFSIYGMGDWLNWHMDIGQIGVASFLSFSLPLEGLVSWGLAGFVLYPLIFLLPAMWIAGWISSFKHPLPTSIFLFASLQHGFVEVTSDGFISLFTRGFLMLGFSIFVVQKGLAFSGGGKAEQTLPTTSTAS